MCEKDRVCEVAVHTGDVSRHVRTCGCVSRGECDRDNVQCESRGTREGECEKRMETPTATVARQMPGSGGSCDWDRAGSERSCTGRPCCATGETPACTAARVKTRSGNARGEIADPADGQRSGWVENSERMGSLREHVCGTRRDLHGVLCSQGARCRLRTGRAHVLAWRAPRIARFFFFFMRE